MANFSVVVLTAAPAGLTADGGGGASIKVDGREALLRSVELFLNRDPIKQVLAVFDKAGSDEAKRKFGNHLAFSGVKLIWSGSRWSEQLASAVQEVSGDATHVIVHDAARPCVPFSDIDALLEAAEQHSAAALSTPVRTPLLELDEGGQPVASHRPSQFAQLLTPMVFERSVFVEFASAKQELHPSKLSLIPGSPLNIRVGSAADAGIAKSMMSHLPRPKLKPLNNPFEEAQW